MSYFGGNETDKSRDMWKIAHDFNKKSKELNGYETCVKRRKVKAVERVALT